MEELRLIINLAKIFGTQYFKVTTNDTDYIFKSYADLLNPEIEPTLKDIEITFYDIDDEVLGYASLEIDYNLVFIDYNEFVEKLMSIAYAII